MPERLVEESRLRLLLEEDPNDVPRGGVTDPQRLAALLSAVASPGPRTGAPHPGEEAAVAAFRAARLAEAATQRHSGTAAGPWRRRGRRTTTLGLAAALVLGGGIAVAGGGVPVPDVGRLVGGSGGSTGSPSSPAPSSSPPVEAETPAPGMEPLRPTPRSPAAVPGEGRDGKPATPRQGRSPGQGVEDHRGGKGGRHGNGPKPHPLPDRAPGHDRGPGNDRAPGNDRQRETGRVPGSDSGADRRPAPPERRAGTGEGAHSPEKPVRGTSPHLPSGTSPADRPGGRNGR